MQLFSANLIIIAIQQELKVFPRHVLLHVLMKGKPKNKKSNFREVREVKEGRTVHGFSIVVCVS